MSMGSMPRRLKTLAMSAVIVAPCLATVVSWSIAILPCWTDSLILAFCNVEIDGPGGSDVGPFSTTMSDGAISPVRALAFERDFLSVVKRENGFSFDKIS